MADMTFAELGVEPGKTALVVEAGACNGDLGWALAAVDVAAASGAVWGFKVQMYQRDRLVTRTAPTYGDDYLNEPDTQYEHFDGALSYGDWVAVKVACDESGLVFFASVFDTDAVDMCETLDVPVYKVASADITNKPLIQYVAATGKPMVVSTGGATLGEITEAYRWIDQVNPDVERLPLMCTLSYPCHTHDAHLARVKWWADNVHPMVGYSDHTLGTSAMQSARWLGAVMIEKHFTITPGRGGDHNFAIDPPLLDGWAGLPASYPGVDYERELGSPNLGPRAAEFEAIQAARRSVAAAVDIPNGTIIEPHMLTCLRPGTGAYPPAQLDTLVGVAANIDIPAGTLVPFLGHQPGFTAGRATISANLTVE